MEKSRIVATGRGNENSKVRLNRLGLLIGRLLDGRLTSY